MQAHDKSKLEIISTQNAIKKMGQFGISNQIMEVFVFKTSVKASDLKQLKPVLDNLLSDLKWNFDFEDCDNIFRVECPSDKAELVCHCLSDLGFYCEELV